jgi:exopolysaccharide production protein ExoY
MTHALGGNQKRIFDFMVALLALLWAFPLFICIATLVKLSGPGPIIYKHTRIGLGGRRFSCLKFRSMIVDAENALNVLLEVDPSARTEWERCQKLVVDPRITPLGRFLRQTSFDELPQIINVVRGEMSLVGPRPIVPSEVSRYGKWLGLYLSARPGLTGAWQISGRSDCAYNKRVELDTIYVCDWRFSTDLFILLRTVGAVAKRIGSY